MASLNKVQIIGNVTRDPEVKFTPKGTAVCEMSVAVNRKWKADGGEMKEEVTFINVELWGRLAEIAGEYAKKGRSVYVEGRLSQDSWEDKQSGQKRTKTKVIGESLQLLGGRGEGKSEGGERQQSRPAPSSGPRVPADDSGDIPFAPNVL